MSSVRGITAWTPVALALAIVAGGGTTAAAHDHHAASGHVRASSAAQRSRLFRVETQTLGRAHALEHLAARRAAARLAARRAAMTPAQRRSAQRRVVTAHAAAVAGENPALDGRWDPHAFELPTYAIHSAMLPTGKVVFYGYPYDNSPARPERGDAWIWDPAKGTGAASFQHVAPPLAVQSHPDDPSNPKQPDQIFCSGQSFLPNGQLLVTGGNRTWAAQQGIKRVYTFNPWAAGTEADPYWTRQPDMQSGRWYPSQVELADGRTFIIGGFGEDGAFHKDADVFTPGNGLGAVGTTDPAPSAAERWLDNYPHLFLLGNGDVGAVSPTMVGGTPPTGILRVSATGGLNWDASADRWMNQSLRGYAPAVLEPGHTGATGRITIMGGFDQWDPSFGANGGNRATNTTESIDLLAADPKWELQSPLIVPRSDQDVVLLPDGSMVTVGGGSGQTPATGNYGATGAERKVELWDRATGTWRLGAEQQYKRTYHSTALLLPDGRVWSAGDDQHFGGTEAWKLDANGEPIENADSDHAEIYSPPYLFSADGSLAPRPAIASAPTEMPWNVPFWVGSQDHVARAVLVAPAAVTHKVDMNQRHVELRVVRRADGSGAQVLAPPTSAVAPPGYYMLFVLDDHGVPSVARWVRLGADAPAPAAEPAPEPAPAPVDPAPTDPSTTTTAGPGPTPAPARPVIATSSVLTAPKVALKTGSARALRRSHKLVISVTAGRPGTLTLRVSLGSGGRVVRLPTLQRRLPRAGRYTLTIAVPRSALQRAAPKGRIRVGLAARQTGSVAVAQADVTLR